MSGNAAQLIAAVIQVYTMVLLARIVASWVNLDPSNQLVQVLHQLTEPVLEPVRRVLPTAGMIDISPLVVCVGLHLLQRFVLSLGADF